MRFKYYNRKELYSLIGKILLFKGFNSIKKGELTYKDNKYWLPFCGKVNAETVQIAINNQDDRK